MKPKTVIPFAFGAAAVAVLWWLTRETIKEETQSELQEPGGLISRMQKLKRLCADIDNQERDTPEYRTAIIKALIAVLDTQGAGFPTYQIVTSQQPYFFSVRIVLDCETKAQLILSFDGGYSSATREFYDGNGYVAQSLTEVPVENLIMIMNLDRSLDLTPKTLVAARMNYSEDCLDPEDYDAEDAGG